MNKCFVLVLALVCSTLPVLAQKSVTLEELLSTPFPENLTAAKTANRIAWTFNQEGKRNIWVAEGPAYTARRLTSYLQDDGQPLSELAFSEDGTTIVYVRGEGKNVSGQFPNPTTNPAGTEQTVWSVAWSGGEPNRVDAGDSPKISAKGVIAYVRDGQIWTASLDSSEKPKQLIVRGQNHSEEWSPDGSQLVFVSTRGDHSFIGVYELAGNSVRFLVPSVDTDSDAVWSPDGKRIAFVRRPAEQRDTPAGYFLQPDKPHPWAIWVADVSTASSREIWHSSASPDGSYPFMAKDTGGGVIRWAAENRLLIASEEDGWQHLYSLSVESGSPHLLTPGNCEVEQWSLTPDKKAVLFNSNCGDIDRRHIWRVGVDKGSPQSVTTGIGLEWSPVPLSDGKTFAYLGSTSKLPPQTFWGKLDEPGNAKILGLDSWSNNPVVDALVIPQQVIFKAADGFEIHGQLFLPNHSKAGEKRSALVFMHGGPIRQMLLGWHYMYYYANSYAMNQYLASCGYVVLSVNYRSGIGYGRAFREAPGRAGRGASEYKDIVAAGKYLQGRSDVDPSRVGLWGGSYGGYLTALGLARNSDIFAAGVDFHGVHDWPTDNWDGKNISPELTKLAHESSPVTSVETWKSPVLFIHGDDDRNVYFTQTVDLVARLRTRGVAIEQLIFPDEVHDFLLHRDWLAGYRATSDFFDRRLKQRRDASGTTAKTQ
ncbi:MAG: peptidase prolyl oligopeptidase active site domain protein [Candidatus Acidoferrum typicum]|nr:peptidase prolyl oligopeptidase active site domain protein [Candidatus Acidoferrum typicum]